MSKGYAGTVEIEHLIFRYKHNTSDMVVLSNQVPIGEEEYYQELAIKLAVTGSSYFLPGKAAAKKEESYPEEYDVEIHKVIGPDGREMFPALSKQEKASILEAIDQSVKEQAILLC